MSYEKNCIEVNPKRVLQVVGGMNAGGIETLIMSIYRIIDRSKVQFDFLLPPHHEPYFYEDEIERLGGIVYKVHVGRRHPFKARLNLRKFYADHPYDVAHFHMGIMSYLVPLREAEKARVPTRVLHSHCAFPQPKGAYDHAMNVCHKANKAFSLGLATDCFACGTGAARWFGFDRLPEPSRWHMINNGIDTARFAFDPTKRASARAELGIGCDEFVVGNVGRLSPQKNQVFLAEVFAGLLKVRPESRWLLVGSGSLESNIRSCCESLGVWDRVIHLENRGDIDRLQCAMDAFAFPSLYEGLSIAFVEAQSSGVPCFASDTIPSEGLVTQEAKTLPIDRGVDPWVEALASLPVGARIEGAANEVRSAGFDIRATAEWLQEFYLDRSMRGSRKEAGL